MRVKSRKVARALRRPPRLIKLVMVDPKRRGTIASRQDEEEAAEEVADADTSLMSEDLEPLPSPKRKVRGGPTAAFERFDEKETPRKPTGANEVKKRLSMPHLDT